MPQALAYAKLAGMPAEHGLFAAALPPIVAALLASSPYLQTGPVAVTALLTFGALSSFAPPASSEYVQLGLLLALIVGLARLTMGLARLGWLAYLMSEPVIQGFVSAAALLIVASQVPYLVDASAAGGVAGEAARILTSPDDWSLGALAVAAGTLLLVVGGRRAHPLVPGVLIAAALATAVSAFTGYPGQTIGPLDTGLPPISIDLPWARTPELLLPGLVIAVVGFAEPASIARVLAARNRRPWDADRELVSQGAANVAAAIGGGFPVGGSFSRSALASSAGAQTRWCGAIAGACVLAFLPFAGVLSLLPTAMLGAAVVAAVAALVRPRAMVALWSASRAQAVVAWATFGATLALAPRIDRALVIGVGASIAVHLWRELSLEIMTSHEGDVLSLRPHGVLWFGSAERLRDICLRQVASTPTTTEVVLRLDGLGRIDLTGAMALRRLRAELDEAGVVLRFVAVPPQAQRLVSRTLEISVDRGAFM